MSNILKASITTGLLAFAMQTQCAEKADTVTVPWHQFKDLYREHLKKELSKQFIKAKAKVIPTELSSSVCTIVFSKKTCQISYEIKGRRGNVDSEQLLRGRFAVSSPTTTGCARLLWIKHSLGITLLPEGTPEFTTKFTISVPVLEKNGNYHASLEIPNSLTNKIHVELKDKLYLNKLPWSKIEGKNNIYTAPPGVITLSAIDENIANIKLPPDLDLFTSYRFRANRLQLQIKALVNPGSGRAFILQLPKGARSSRGTLPRFVKLESSGKLNVTLPENINRFSLNCEFELKSRQQIEKLIQPSIAENRGREGFFNIEQPPGAEIKVTSKGLQSDIFNLSDNSKPVKCLSSPIANPLSFTIKQLTRVSQPEVIVDTIFFCSAIEENGSVISVLSFDYPGTGKLKLKKIANGKLWRFAVNGKKSGIYEDGDYWRVELPAGHDSNKVEMAFLLSGKKPGIQGIYRSTMPDCGLNARRVVYTAVLPKRLELRGFEGGVDPLPKDISPPRLPDNVSGNRYNFYRPYYTGGKIDAEFFYREPPEKQ